jgi:hypothetical protein
LLFQLGALGGQYAGLGVLCHNRLAMLTVIMATCNALDTVHYLRIGRMEFHDIP